MFRIYPLVSLVFIALTTPLVNSQLALPDPPYLPPNASFGAQPSDIAANSSEVNPHWATLLGNLLYFYDAQRSGPLPSNERVTWRNSSALEDGQDVGLDLSGGYYDAGDYIKYTFPLSFTLMSACWGALDMGRGYDLANQTAYLDDMLRWGLDWLIKAHPSPNTLFVQVGDEDLDNAYWGGDQGIPTPRPSYQINDTSPGTDAAAQASAAFSACSALYASTTFPNANSTLVSSPSPLRNTTYASILLTHAQQLYQFSRNATGGQCVYQTSVPSVADAYASSAYGDELAIAALFLSLASSSNQSSSAYYADASNYFDQFGLVQQMEQGSEAVFNWDSKTPGVVVLAAQIASAFPNVTQGISAGNLSYWQNIAEGYFDRIINGTGRSYLTHGGLLYYPGDSDEASLNPALNAAMLMVRYAAAGLATTGAKATSYLTFAQDQLNYVLGKNPMYVPYVVGTHPNSPQNPHSALSTGAAPADIAHINTVPAHEAYVLYGAVPGGPLVSDRFWDLRGDWVQSEPALDYAAPLLALAAHALADRQGDPWYTGVEPGAYARVRPAGWPCDAAVREGCVGGGLGVGAEVAMGVVLGLVGSVLMGLAGYWIWLVVKNGSKL